MAHLSNTSIYLCISVLEQNKTWEINFNWSPSLVIFITTQINVLSNVLWPTLLLYRCNLEGNRLQKGTGASCNYTRHKQNNYFMLHGCATSIKYRSLLLPAEWRYPPLPSILTCTYSLYPLVTGKECGLWNQIHLKSNPFPVIQKCITRSTFTCVQVFLHYKRICFYFCFVWQLLPRTIIPKAQGNQVSRYPRFSLFFKMLPQETWQVGGSICNKGSGRQLQGYVV